MIVKIHFSTVYIIGDCNYYTDFGINKIIQ